MDLQTIFFVQISMECADFHAYLSLVCQARGWPTSPGMKRYKSCFCHMPFAMYGLFFLVPAFVTSDLSPSFANITAYGDLATAVLAIVALLALRAKFAFALPLVWLVNLVGTVDLIKALSEAENIPHLGVVSFVPTFIVPLLLVSHVVIFTRLLRKNTEPSTDHAAA